MAIHRVGKSAVPGQDPLAGLRDIHLPEPLGFWPPAPGWWVLALLGLALLAGLAYWLHRYLRRARFRRRVQQTLPPRPETSSSAYLGELNALLKRVARHHYGAASVDALSGEQWIDFLMRTDPELDAREVSALVKGSVAPRPELAADRAEAIARHWLRRHGC